MIFRTPWILLFIPVILAVLLTLRKRQRLATLRFPSSELLANLPTTWKMRFYCLPFYLRLLALTLFCVALAGPQKILKEAVHKTEGIDIVLDVDASGSMSAEDFKINGRRVNRLTVVKDVVNEFIDGRHDDRLGLVAFAGLAYTVCPLTTDYSWLKTNLQRIDFKMMEDMTAIGSALMTSLARLEKSHVKSKVIILLTDGINNAGKVDPLVAAQAAKAMGVKIYTIGVGTKGYVPYPDQDLWGRTFYREVQFDIDEDLLKKIADLTGGQYFSASDTETLRKIYHDIDALEKTVMNETGYQEYDELFVWFLLTALGLLVLELTLANSLLLRIP